MTDLVPRRLRDGLDLVRSAPRDQGTLEMIVRRPGPAEREVLDEAELSLELGLVGDTWCSRPSRHTPDGSPEPARQVTLMGARAIDLIAGDRSRWALAGDQLFVDLDLSVDVLPAGSRLAVGDAVLEVSEEPHTGCDKFTKHFGLEALRLLGSPEGLSLRLRGLNARVVVPGRIATGQTVTRV